MAADPASGTDADLVRAARSGDPRALDALVDRHYGPVYALAMRMLGNATDARDAAQETFTRAVAALASFDPSRPFAPWILSITANLVRDRFRRRKPAALSSPERDEPAVDLPPDARLIGDEDRDRVLAALESLPFDFRIVAVLTYQGRSPAEISDVLGVSANAIRIRLFRALARLREALREQP